MLISARLAVAQEVTIGYQGLPYKHTGESATGINVAEGMLLHVGAGVEAGYDSNVFYGNSDTGVTGSGIIRATGYAEFTNTTRATGAPGGLTFDLRGGMTYRRYTSDDPAVVPFHDAFMPSAGLSLGYGTGRLSFQLTDSFVRVEDPPYANSTNYPLSRDSNLATAEVHWSPGGGRISTMFRYTNVIDVFEATAFEYGSTVTHQLLADVSWKWLPKTAIFIDAYQGYVTYLNAGAADKAGKVDSYPLHVLAGLRGLITPKLSVNLSVGYANSFSSSGATTGGIFGSTFIEAQATYNPTLMSRLVGGYHHDFANSVISAFYYEDAIYASYVQQLGGRLAFDLSGRYAHRNYQALLFPGAGEPATRVDNLFTLGATLDYFVRNWIYAGVGYSLLSNVSDYQVAGHSVEYTKHQVFARVGVSY
ncbi:MAG TPA: hypothetical protein VHJ20_05145 [Polyangia bacterium]|nr:hypothetical protein [Polyangia bacterium]